jgi:hypothetical protein
MATTPSKTAIATPRTLDLKQVQALADSVKARFGQVESDVALLSTARSNTINLQTLDTIQRNISTLATQLSALRDTVSAISTASGVTAEPPRTFWDADEPEAAFF